MKNATQTLTLKHDLRSYRVVVTGNEVTRIYDVSHGKAVDLSTKRAQQIARKALKQVTNEKVDAYCDVLNAAEARKREILEGGRK